MKIVLCEDEPLIQRLFQRVLIGYELHIASDGVEGLAMIERVKPDLILSGISMPRMDGFQLLSAIRERTNIASIPVIFITGFAQRYNRNEALRLGATGYLVKPVEVGTLRTAVEAALAATGRS